MLLGKRQARERFGFALEASLAFSMILGYT
jgi:hypothetical protein